MRFPRYLAGAGVATLMTLTACAPTPAANETELFRVAQTNHWTADDWVAFSRWVDWLNFCALNDRANNGDHDAVRALIGLFFPDAYDTFVRIIARESGFNPRAYNRSGASGLLQIMAPMHDWRYRAHGWDPQTARFDAALNLTIGREMFNESGLSPWRLTA